MKSRHDCLTFILALQALPNDTNIYYQKRETLYSINLYVKDIESFSLSRID